MTEKRQTGLGVVMLLLICLALGGVQARPVAAETFKKISLDSFIDQEKKAVGPKGKRLIKMTVPIRFEAKMKRFPEERQMTYIYTALRLTGVSPMPEVEHRMFVESEEGRIIPVYVEKQVAGRLAKDLKEEEAASFLGYHVYSYSKGPAILVVDFSPAEK